MHVYLFLCRYVRIWSERLSLLFNCKLSWGIHRSMYIHTTCVSIYKCSYVVQAQDDTSTHFADDTGLDKGDIVEGNFSRNETHQNKIYACPYSPIRVFDKGFGESFASLYTWERVGKDSADASCHIWMSHVCRLVVSKMKDESCEVLRWIVSRSMSPGTYVRVRRGTYGWVVTHISCGRVIQRNSGLQLLSKELESGD